MYSQAFVILCSLDWTCSVHVYIFQKLVLTIVLLANHQEITAAPSLPKQCAYLSSNLRKMVENICVSFNMVM